MSTEAIQSCVDTRSRPHHRGPSGVRSSFVTIKEISRPAGDAASSKCVASLAGCPGLCRIKLIGRRVFAVASDPRQQVGHCRQWSMKVRYGHQRQKQGGDPEYVVVREESQQRQNRNDFELQLVGVLVGHVLRQGVQSEINAAKRNDQHNGDASGISDSPGAVMNAGRCWGAAGFIPVAICALLAMSRGGFPA